MKATQVSTNRPKALSNFKLTIQYDGTDFKGWQTQKNGERTVQSEFVKAAEIIFKQSVTIIASGRTDRGVHALGQVISFKANTRMKPAEIIRAFNSHLPQDVAVLAAQEVNDRFHAQMSAKEKTYTYTILNSKIRQPLLVKYTLFFPYDLNVSLMKKGAKYFKGKQDFKSFQAYDLLRVDKNTVRTIKRVSITSKANMITISVTGDGFLYKMVRNMVGALLAVGRSQIKPQHVAEILNAKNRQLAPKTAPAHGLMLLRVKY